EPIFREKPAIHRFPGSMAERVRELAATITEDYGGDASRLWTEAADGADLRRRIAALPGFGEMKIKSLGAVLAKRFDVAVAQERGVAVRLAYNLDHAKTAPVPPPPITDPDALEADPFPTAAIPGVPDLMHHKYVVRDGAAVWTGSLNWTADSWTREENVVITVESPAVAGRYLADFEQLWTTREVSGSGKEIGRAAWRE